MPLIQKSDWLTVSIDRMMIQPLSLGYLLAVEAYEMEEVRSLR